MTPEQQERLEYLNQTLSKMKNWEVNFFELAGLLRKYVTSEIQEIEQKPLVESRDEMLEKMGITKVSCKVLKENPMADL